jgi:hypothetical protein
MLPELSTGCGRVAGCLPKGSDEKAGEVVEFGGRLRSAGTLPSPLVTSVLHTPRIEFPLSTGGF